MENPPESQRGGRNLTVTTDQGSKAQPVVYEGHAPSLSSSSSAASASSRLLARRGVGALLTYLKEELGGADHLPHDPAKQNEINNFFQVPLGLEKACPFRSALPLLPIDFASPAGVPGVLHLPRLVFVCLHVPASASLPWRRPHRLGHLQREVRPIGGGGGGPIILTAFLLDRAIKATFKYDLMRGAILAGSCWLLTYIDISMAYHSIRGQALFKLYVIFNLLEVVDKLCCAFGQDIFDALFSRVVASANTSSTFHSAWFLFPHFFIAGAYTGSSSRSVLSIRPDLCDDAALHSLVLLYLMITLNVAINSGGGSLITLLVSNQFVELKTAVFKKYSRENLFQISCSGSFAFHSRHISSH